MEDAMGRERFIVRPLSFGFDALDFAMKPMMWAVGGGRKDSLQETHCWHCQRIDGAGLDPKMSVFVSGQDRSRASNRFFLLPTFHLPFLGGWRNYSVFEVGPYVKAWYVGWINVEVPPGFRKKSCIHKLRISDRRVKMLTLPRGCITQFFAVDEAGFQVDLYEVGAGLLGDGAYSDVRLF